jgi:hypothetical protein
MTTSTLSLLVMLVAAAHQPLASVDATAPWRIGRLPSRVALDLARLGSMPSIAILGAGGGAALAVHPADARTSRSLSAAVAAEESLDGGATIGGAPVQLGLAAAVYGIGLAAHHAGAAETGSALVEAQLVGGIVTQGLKYAVDRQRPNGGHHSFPSGHTSSAVATADVILQRFGWRAGAAAYVAAAYVGASRIAERDHYLSDTVFGAAVGIASARTIRASVGHTSVDVSPLALPGGGAVLISIQRRP